jgi:hypothetical protein
MIKVLTSLYHIFLSHSLKHYIHLQETTNDFSKTKATHVRSRFLLRRHILDKQADVPRYENRHRAMLSHGEP